MATVTWPLFAPRRAVFGGDNGEGDFTCLGVDWSGDDFDMQVRPDPGDTAASALITLAKVSAAGAQGILATYDATLVHPETGLVVGGTLIRIQINQGGLQDLPWPADDPSQPLVLAYDLRHTPAYGAVRIVARGSFTVLPGVTI